jgi:tRNA/tmRNA/rRNA uracil-C5-methylase (TrmA/RlmC/RlmD family)
MVRYANVYGRISSNKQLKSFYAGELNVIKLTSEAKARCGYFGECGGCALQNLSYDEQVALKEKAYKNIFSKLSEDLPPLEVLLSPDPYYYRLRMDYVLISHPIYEPHDRMGLRKKKNFSYVIDLESCHLIPIDKFVMLRKVFLKALELAIPLTILRQEKAY